MQIWLLLYQNRVFFSQSGSEKRIGGYLRVTKGAMRITRRRRVGERRERWFLRDVAAGEQRDVAENYHFFLFSASRINKSLFRWISQKRLFVDKIRLLLLGPV